jgi:hypothetical protein
MIQSAMGRAAVWLYPHLLKLYPGRFYATFAEEMVDVFTLSVQETAQQGIIPLLRLLVSELAELPVTLIAERVYERRKRSMMLLEHGTSREIHFARWIARGLSLVTLGFMLAIAMLNEDFLTDITPPTVILAILFLFTLLAWRWERVGGILTMSLTPFFFLSILVENSNSVGLITPFWVLSLLAAGSAFYFLIVGWLFVSVAQHEELAKVAGERRSTPASGKRRLRNYLMVGVLGIVALAFFFVPTIVPVQQRFEPLHDRFFEVEGIIGALRAERAVVGISNIPAQQPFLSVGGRELDVNGEMVEVYTYTDTASATTDASRIYYDVDGPAWNDAAWAGPPHFYQVANVILIYKGHNEEMLSLLERAFGPPFAER